MTQANFLQPLAGESMNSVAVLQPKTGQLLLALAFQSPLCVFPTAHTIPKPAPLRCEKSTPRNIHVIYSGGSISIRINLLRQAEAAFPLSLRESDLHRGALMQISDDHDAATKFKAALKLAVSRNHLETEDNPRGIRYKLTEAGRAWLAKNYGAKIEALDL